MNPGILILTDATDLAHAWVEVLRAAGRQITVGHATNDASRGSLALAAAVAVAVVDVDQGQLGQGLELVALRNRYRAQATPIRILAVTQDFSARRVLELALRCDLVLPKPVEPELLVRAVDTLLEHETAVVRFTRRYRLSPQELMLLQSALAGKNNDESAADLGCARATVATYWNRIFRKTGVRSQRDLMVLLLRDSSESGEYLSVRAPLVAGRTPADGPTATKTQKKHQCG